MRYQRRDPARGFETAYLAERVNGTLYWDLNKPSTMGQLIDEKRRLNCGHKTQRWFIVDRQGTKICTIPHPGKCFTKVYRPVPDPALEVRRMHPPTPLGPANLFKGNPLEILRGLFNRMPIIGRTYPAVY